MLLGFFLLFGFLFAALRLLLWRGSLRRDTGGCSFDLRRWGAALLRRSRGLRLLRPRDLLAPFLLRLRGLRRGCRALLLLQFGLPARAFRTSGFSLLLRRAAFLESLLLLSPLAAARFSFLRCERLALLLPLDSRVLINRRDDAFNAMLFVRLRNFRLCRLRRLRFFGRRDKWLKTTLSFFAAGHVFGCWRKGSRLRSRGFFALGLAHFFWRGCADCVRRGQDSGRGSKRRGLFSFGTFGCHRWRSRRRRLRGDCRLDWRWLTFFAFGCLSSNGCGWRSFPRWWHTRRRLSRECSFRHGWLTFFAFASFRRNCRRCTCYG